MAIHDETSNLAKVGASEIEVLSDFSRFNITPRNLALLQSVRNALQPLPIGSYVKIYGRAIFLLPMCYKHLASKISLIHDSAVSRKTIELWDIDSLTTCFEEPNLNYIDPAIFDRLAEWLVNQETHVIEAWDYMIDTVAVNRDSEELIVPVSQSRPTTGPISCQQYADLQAVRNGQRVETAQRIDVVVQLEVSDESAFRHAAYRREVRGECESPSDFLDPRFSNLDACACMLVDPGISPDGASILGSFVVSPSEQQLESPEVKNDGTPTRVRKTVIQFTVLHDDERDLGSMSLEAICQDCDEGGYIGGGLTVLSSDALTAEQVDAEASKLGSDASFFDIEVNAGSNPT